MHLRTFLFAVVISLLSQVQNAAAQQPAVGSPSVEDAPAVGDEVVVRGRRMSDIEDGLRAEIGEFIGEVSVTPAGRGLARWDRRVCIGVHNLAQTPAQYIVDRVSKLALDVGLTPGEPGCGPNVVIIFTTDGKELATYLVDEERKYLRPTGEGGVTRGLAALNDFASTDKAVRWWQVSIPVSAQSGIPAIELGGGGSPFEDGSPTHDAPTIAVAGPSRIHSGIVDSLERVIIVVDSTKLHGTTWQQLGDYLAVVSLAQVDLETNPSGFDSILNLFTNPAAYSGLTDWDRTYMQALYQFDQERNPSLQRGALTSEMLQLELGNQFGE
jgi:hypothetical protein